MQTELKKYAQHWKTHLRSMEKARGNLLKRAMADAVKIADYLRERYGCGEIYLIGSALEKERFSERSDIDMVIKGLPKERYFHILAEVKDITDFSVDIIPYEDANELVINTVIEEGKLL